MTGPAGPSADLPEPGSQAEPGTQPGAVAPSPARRRLSLSRPVPGRTSHDRPEAWGDPADTDADRLRHYVEQRPPHHGD